MCASTPNTELSAMPQVVHVAVGVLYNAQRQVLIAQRPHGVHQGGKLEFPGGKVEPTETVQVALAREFEEELGVHVDVNAIQPLINLTHHYSDASVRLDVWEVHDYKGTPFGKEGQSIQWLDIDQLELSAFPEANAPIITALRLPNTLMVTPNIDFNEARATLLNIIQASGATHCIVRLPQLTESEYSLVWDSLTRAGLDCTLIVHQHLSLARDKHAPLHLRASQLMAVSPAQLNGVGGVSASVHTEAEQQQAEHLGARFTLFGAVKATPTHAGEQGVGWLALQTFTARACVPVYAVGGMTLNDVATAREYGAQGVAGIRLFCEPRM